MNAADFFTPEGKKLIEQAIAEAELCTSGEIRVHVESAFSGDILDKASAAFALLKMHKTAQRNGVLFFLGLKNRKFAILGDAGINHVVPADFWDNIKKVMEEYFSRSEFAEGLAAGVKMAGEQLKIHFPVQKDDVNELSNEVTIN